MKQSTPIDPVAFAQRLRRWEEITMLGLAFYGARRLRGRARSFAQCVAEGLRAANRARLGSRSRVLSRWRRY